MKKIFALALAAIMTASMATVAFAAADGKYEGVEVGVDASGSPLTKVYVLSDSRAENVVDNGSEKDAEGDEFEGGDRIAIPLVVWDDADADGEFQTTDDLAWYTNKVDYDRSTTARTDWKVGDADVEVELVKFDGTNSVGISAGTYVYCAIITLPENNGNKAVDLAGTIQVGRSSSSAKNGNKMEIGLSYMPDATSANVTTPVGSTTLGAATGIVAFDKTEGVIDLDFENAVGIMATYTVDVSSQNKLNLAWNTSFDKTFGNKYNYANLSFIEFEGQPEFNKNGTLYIYAEDENTFVYEATEDGAKAVDAVWNEDYEAWEIKTRKLTKYVVSDVELDEQTVTEDGSSSTTDGGKDNPDTGR